MCECRRRAGPAAMVPGMRRCSRRSTACPSCTAAWSRPSSPALRRMRLPPASRLCRCAPTLRLAVCSLMQLPVQAVQLLGAVSLCRPCAGRACRLHPGCAGVHLPCACSVMQRTLNCLSELYSCLELSVFAGLALDALAACIQADPLLFA